MYYLELIQRFWDYNQKAKLNTTAIALYLYLLKLCNDNNGYDVAVSDVVISNILGLTRKTVKPTKEKLQNLGLIRYESKNGKTSSYKIVLDYSFQLLETEKKQKQNINSLFNIPLGEKTNFSPVDLEAQNLNKIIKHSDEIVRRNIPNPKMDNDKIPSSEEFIEYAKTLDSYETTLDEAIKDKYYAWVGTDWRNSSGRPITNWKASLKSVLPYLNNKTDGKDLSVLSVPNIKPPTSSLE